MFQLKKLNVGNQKVNISVYENVQDISTVNLTIIVKKSYTRILEHVWKSVI